MARIHWRDALEQSRIQLAADAGDAESDDWESLPFSQAIDYLMSKGAITSAQFAAIEAWAQQRAFTVAGVTKLDLIQATLDSLTQTIQDGGTLADFASQINDVFDAAGVDELDPWRLETIFRTNVGSAYGSGRWDQLTDPDTSDQMYGWEFDDVEDDREDEECAALGGHVFEGDDGAQYFPPIHFNCRCSAKLITSAEAEDDGITASGDVSSVASDFVKSSDFASPALGAPYRADLTSYAPQAARDFLAEQNGT